MGGHAHLVCRRELLRTVIQELHIKAYVKQVASHGYPYITCCWVGLSESGSVSAWSRAPRCTNCKQRTSGVSCDCDIKQVSLIPADRVHVCVK